MLVSTGGISFKRGTRPMDAFGLCMQICYWDCADPAYVIAIYVRWELSGGTFWVYLVAAKVRVAPMLMCPIRPLCSWPGWWVEGHLLGGLRGPVSGLDILPSSYWTSKCRYYQLTCLYLALASAMWLLIFVDRLFARGRVLVRL